MQTKSGINICDALCCAGRKFFERIILCNSLMWSCELTGQSGLTYQEAARSELRAKNRLEAIPDALRKPLLLLMRLTRQSNIRNARDDIFPFVARHFFVDEEVMAVVGSNERHVSLYICMLIHYILASVL